MYLCVYVVYVKSQAFGTVFCIGKIIVKGHSEIFGRTGSKKTNIINVYVYLVSVPQLCELY